MATIGGGGGQRKTTKTKLAVRQQEAVVLPHDGPLYHLLITQNHSKQDKNYALFLDDKGPLPQQQGHTRSVQSNQDYENYNHNKSAVLLDIVCKEEDVVSQKALDLLISTSVGANDAWEDSVKLKKHEAEDGDPRTTSSTITAAPYGPETSLPEKEALALMRNLRSCRLIQHQLAALQLYKSRLLQHQQQEHSLEIKKPRSPDSSDDEDHRNTVDSTSPENAARRNYSNSAIDDNDTAPLWLVYAALYRILLEWSASFETPLPLRKCIHSVLDSLWKMKPLTSALPRTNTSATTTLLSVSFVNILESITNQTVHLPQSDMAARFWQSPVHSLDVLFSAAQLHDDGDKDPKATIAATGHHDTRDVSSGETSLVSNFLQRVWPFLQWLTSTQLLPSIESMVRPQYALDSPADQPYHQQTKHNILSSRATTSVEDDVAENLKNAIQLSSLTKTLLEAFPILLAKHEGLKDFQDKLPSLFCRDVLSKLTWSLLACPWTPTESLVVVAMAHGHVLSGNVFSNDDKEKEGNGTSKVSAMGNALNWKSQLNSSFNTDQPVSLPELPWAVWLQGLLAAAATDEDLFGIDPAKNAIAGAAVPTLDPEVRLVGIKGLRTLSNRCSSFVLTLYRNNQREEATAIRVLDKENEAVQLDCSRVVDELMECILAAWESPPTRKLANAIPPLFEAALDLSFLIASTSRQQQRNAEGDSRQNPPNQLQPQENHVSQILVERFLLQPPNRKGRYKALELLLPRVGAKRLLQAGNQLTQQRTCRKMEVSSNESSIQSESQLLDDLLTGIAEIGNNTGPIADLWAKLLQGLLLEEERKNEDTTIDQGRWLPSKWIDAWVPSLARSLTYATDSKRRKQVASFCLPRISVLVSGRNTIAVAESFTAIIDHVHNKLQPANDILADIPSTEHESFQDRRLWTLCEVVRYAAAERLFPQDRSFTSRYPKLEQAIAAAIPLEILRGALLHFSPWVRIAAFQAMNAIVSTYKDNKECGDPAIAVYTFTLEVDLWKETLPYVVKTDAKEYMSSLLYCLLSFIDRLSLNEAVLQDDGTGSRSSAGNEMESALYEFVVSFLLEDLFIRKGAYPGTVLVKETFSLALLECVVVFACRELDIVLDSKLLPKTGVVFNRKRNQQEEMVLSAIRQSIIGPEVMASLKSLLQSSWDGTRAAAFHMLSCQILIERTYGLQSKPALVNYHSSFGEKRALFLVSSPRQREADTGARTLAILCLRKTSMDKRIQFVENLLSILRQRTQDMQLALVKILSDEQDLSSGGQLPLAHGIIRTLQFILSSPALREQGAFIPLGLLNSLSVTMCSALQVSLSVVADVKHGEQLEGLDNEGNEAINPDALSTSGKINPGAIGANGIFASVSRLDDAEYQRRLASQRIIMGSWLLMKESCASIASILTTKENTPDDAQVNQAGVLLISTLTSLKHTGAAYAAHNAFQQIAQLPFQHKHLQHLTAAWINRLLAEITHSEKIRDSTLRRSTGYGLGFLSIMRSEVACCKHPRLLCRNITQSILRLAMPPDEWLNRFLVTVYGTCVDQEIFFLFKNTTFGSTCVQERPYIVRSRIHALNVLRMIVLDAPLSQDIRPLIGDAIAVAIVGYVDPEWGVRNSSTMVFAACLLRIVDADKNAANAEGKSSHAITIAELFRLYPDLSGFLVAVLSCSVAGKLEVARYLPPILPILILLYRVQSARASDYDSVAQFDLFVPYVVECLSHSHLALRKAAARALGNMASTRQQSPSFWGSIFGRAIDVVQRKHCWNNVHGCLLVIRKIFQAVSFSIERQWVQTLFTLVPLDHELKKIPPICSAEAFHALHGLSKDDNEWSSQLSTACFTTLSLACHNKSNASVLVGQAELVRIASTVATSVVVQEMLSSIDTSRPLANDDAGKMSYLLQCSDIDARIAAVKTMKKNVYNLVDHALLSSKRNENVAARVLEQLRELILAALRAEVARFTQTTGGAHPPTLRRLSRCLLECVEAEHKLRPRQQMDLWIGRIGYDLFGVYKLSLRPREGTKSDSDDKNAPNLLGNVAEIICWDPQPSRFAELIELVERLSEPVVSWRLRYSAGKVVTKLLFEGSLPEILKVRVWNTCTKLLQDADVDVRYVASRAINAFHSSGILASVPEFTLSRVVVWEPSLVQLVLSRLHFLGSDSQFKAVLLSKELLESFREGHIENIPNVGTNRKIFEEEEPNSYVEVMLDFQVTLRKLTTLHFENVHASEIEGAKKEAVRLCNTLLLTFSELPDVLVVEMTRSNALFPGLHSLLLGCAGLVYLGIVERIDIREKVVTRLCGADCHPLIQSVARVLLSSQKADSATFDSVANSCFLLPRDGWTRFGW
ncbi:hypothetical protein ACA910_000394 [Epithemia clementina (nom. ined.)]